MHVIEKPPSTTRWIVLTLLREGSGERDALSTPRLCAGAGMGLESETNQTGVQATSLAGCVTWGRLLNLSVHSFLTWKRRVITASQGCCEIMIMKHSPGHRERGQYRLAIIMRSFP